LHVLFFQGKFFYSPGIAPAMNVETPQPAPVAARTVTPACWTAIAALAENRVIGCQGKIPWHLPEDFQWFKATTMGHVLVMGRKTFESIGRPLPGRETVIISRAGFSAAGTRTIASLEAVDGLDLAGKKIFIAGGAEIYAQALPRCNELLLTRVKQAPEGDAFFPSFENQFQLAETVRETPAFSIERYVRR
jgi:dihydrofolate reductase